MGTPGAAWDSLTGGAGEGREAGEDGGDGDKGVVLNLGPRYGEGVVGKLDTLSLHRVTYSHSKVSIKG